ncbi:hypothetical protein [Nocardia sp. NPDC051750]|uniref:hypothetical protein n=1 Tax=Nocardia sp. NPDC051750 TaxID=3364325 RepID=UPI0037A9B53F
MNSGFHPQQPRGHILFTRFDTDRALGMGSGDFGMLYSFIDPAGLLAAGFGATRTYWDCS